MRTVMRSLFLVFAVLVRAPGASAQACLGLPPFTDASIHLNLSGEFPDSATAYAIGIGAGAPSGLFANLGGGRVEYQGLDERSTFGFAELGFQLPAGRFQLCPVAGGYLGAGPDPEGGAIKVTSRGASAGAALGFQVAVPFVIVIPNIAVKYEYLSQKVSEFEVGSVTDTFHSGVVDLGVGLAYRNRISVQPLVHLPFASEDDQISFGVFASVILPVPVPGGLLGR